MNTKLFWIVMIGGEVLAGFAMIGASYGLLPQSAISAAALAFAPVSVVLYHLVFVAPYTNTLRDRSVQQGILIDELLRIREEHRNEMRRAQARLTNLTAGTRKRTRKEMGVSFVYFIADKAANQVKIGVSHDPEKRKAALQGANGSKLELIATIAGDERHEQVLHDQFKHLRLNGEWFHLSPELENFIVSLQEDE